MSLPAIAERPFAFDARVPLLDRVRSIEPLIQESAHALEFDRLAPRNLVDALYDSQIFNALLAQEVGSPEADPIEWLQTIEELARINASVGWMAMIQCGIGLRFLDPDRFARFAERGGGRLILALNLGRMGGSAVKVDGGYRISGRWPFTSGSPYATWLGGISVIADDEGVPVPGPDGLPQPLVAIWPADQATLIDTWDGLGLRGTGSGDFEVSNLFVPDEQVSTEFGGPPTYDRPLFRIHELPELGHGAQALGTAVKAMEDFAGAVASKPVNGSSRAAVMGHNQPHRIAYAKADVLVRAARTLLHETVREAHAYALLEPELPLEMRVRLRDANIFAVRAAREAVDLIFAMAGSSAVFRGRVVEQAFRDINTAANHINTVETAYAAIGSFLLTKDREGGPEIDGRAFL